MNNLLIYCNYLIIIKMSSIYITYFYSKKNNYKYTILTFCSILLS